MRKLSGTPCIALSRCYISIGGEQNTKQFSREKILVFCIERSKIRIIF